MPSPAPVLSVRMSAEERALLEQAAEQARSSLSEFARRRLVEAAELELMMPRPTTIPAAEWERFEAWAHRPPEDLPALRRLADAKPPKWES